MRAIRAPATHKPSGLMAYPNIEGLRISGDLPRSYREILTEPALRFVMELHREFDARRRSLLEDRVRVQEQLDSGSLPAFPDDSDDVRGGDWKVAPIPRDLEDRRVEITGPVDRKMIINALNSGANVFMADFEDSNSPTWDNHVEGHVNLRDAVRREITFTSAEGKDYELGDEIATLMVRPRGWHLVEKHVSVEGEPVSGALFDFGLFFFHNAAELIERGTGPYFYLPKLEHRAEARLWNDVFNAAQDGLGVPRGTIRATVLIENVLASFQMDEILWELRDHSAGLNCGRWDYIFSFIKKFRSRREFVLPDRSLVTMDRRFLGSYVELLIRTCHRRGIHAMGGMAAQIPIKSDPEANERALEKVRQDKYREVKAGHDGTWVAHPGLVQLARAVFDQFMPGPNQIERTREDVSVTAEDLLAVPDGLITEQGLRHNVDVGIRYLEAWLRGSGCVPIYNLMEDAATAEISRSQVWQWVRHGARMEDGRKVEAGLVRETIVAELDKIRREVGGSGFDSGKFRLAGRIFEAMMTSSDFTEWLTAAAYDHLD